MCCSGVQPANKFPASLYFVDTIFAINGVRFFSRLPEIPCYLFVYNPKGASFYTPYMHA